MFSRVDDGQETMKRTFDHRQRHLQRAHRLETENQRTGKGLKPSYRVDRKQVEQHNPRNATADDRDTKIHGENIIRMMESTIEQNGKDVDHCQDDIDEKDDDRSE